MESTDIRNISTEMNIPSLYSSILSCISWCLSVSSFCLGGKKVSLALSTYYTSLHLFQPRDQQQLPGPVAEEREVISLPWTKQSLKWKPLWTDKEIVGVDRGECSAWRPISPFTDHPQSLWWPATSGVCCAVGFVPRLLGMCGWQAWRSGVMCSMTERGDVWHGTHS